MEYSCEQLSLRHIQLEHVTNWASSSSCLIRWPYRSKVTCLLRPRHKERWLPSLRRRVWTKLSVTRPRTTRKRGTLQSPCKLDDCLPNFGEDHGWRQYADGVPKRFCVLTRGMFAYEFATTLLNLRRRLWKRWRRRTMILSHVPGRVSPVSLKSYGKPLSLKYWPEILYCTWYVLITPMPGPALAPG